MASPVVFADANVLYSSPLRDLVMQLAVDGAITLLWSEAVQDEWVRAVLRDRPELASRLHRTRVMMADNLPGAAVTGYEHLIPTLSLPDPDDRHVLAAAIHGGASVLLTFNVKDFPAEASTSGPAAVHPDDFLLLLATTAPDRVRMAAHQILDRLTMPPMTPEQYAATLARAGLPRTAKAIVPLIAP